MELEGVPLKCKSALIKIRFITVLRGWDCGQDIQAIGQCQVCWITSDRFHT